MATEVSAILDALYHGRADEVARLVREHGEETLTIHEAAALGVVSRLERRRQKLRILRCAQDDTKPVKRCWTIN